MLTPNPKTDPCPNHEQLLPLNLRWELNGSLIHLVQTDNIQLYFLAINHLHVFYSFFRKRWHLFPPSQSDALYQTRMPYEESSIFSPINIAKPDLTRFPEFRTATPYVVTLDPGDVLFVPLHWWHFVETIETSISVNSWIEMVRMDKKNDSIVIGIRGIGVKIVFLRFLFCTSGQKFTIYLIC